MIERLSGLLLSKSSNSSVSIRYSAALEVANARTLRKVDILDDLDIFCKYI
jgi:hypothetical protein